MSYKNLILICVFLFSFLQKPEAQNINGLQIPVSRDKLSSITFHSDVTAYFLSDKKSPYHVSTLGNNALMIQTSQEVKEPNSLTVTEGGRTHRFILVYKNDIDLTEQDKDFSNLKELDKLVKQLNNNASNTISNNPAPVNEQNINGTSQANNVINNKNAGADIDNNSNSDNFYTLLDAADAAKKNGQLQEAKTKYEQVLQLKPDNTYAQTQLKEVSDAITNESVLKYSDLITKANNAFSAADYGPALKYYNDVLSLKPDDKYVTSQISLIKQKQEQLKQEEAKRQADSIFNKYIIAGDKAFSENSYTVALINYTEALKINSDNEIATSKMNVVRQKIYTDSVEAVTKANKDLYLSYLNSGDKALEQKSYDAARMAYDEALKLMPGDDVAISKLKYVDTRSMQDSLQAKKAKSKELYDDYIQIADKAFKDNLYDAAKNNYTEALKINPEDTYAKTQIQKIDKALDDIKIQAQKQIEQQENTQRQKQYNDLIASADNYYNSGMLAEAKISYKKALEINGKDQYSKNKISQINDLFLQQKEKDRQDLLNNEKYTGLILKADNDFNNKNYAAAKAGYSKALNLKTGDEYAKSKLSEIENRLTESTVRDQFVKDSLIKDKAVSKQYKDLLGKAAMAYEKGDYAVAKGLYISAADLKPSETEPKTKIAEIDNKMNEITFQNQQKYLSDSILSVADMALTDSDYNGAINNYTKALSLNQTDQEYYINQQISYANKQIVLMDSAAAKQKREAEKQQRVDTLMTFLKRAKDSINARNYGGALTIYNQFIVEARGLDFVPEEQDMNKLIKFAQTKVSDIQEEFRRQKIRDTTVYKLPDAKTLPERKVIYYPTPKDPKLNYVFKKYPDINFNGPPDEQLFDSISDYSVENGLISRYIISANSSVIAEHNSNGINLICQNIIFRDSKVYIKLLLQNQTPEEFLTGSMFLKQTTKGGNTNTMLPDYVDGYPILLPNQQRQIVYVTKLKNVSAGDNFSFELTDRLKKYKVALSIPAEYFQQNK